jgi:hypothetical protein
MSHFAATIHPISSIHPNRLAGRTGLRPHNTAGLGNQAKLEKKPTGDVEADRNQLDI